MTTHRYFALIVATASGLIVAQAQTPGGWRSVNDRPPAAPPQQAQSQDPTQPVDRSDAYGQPAPGYPDPQQQPEARPMPQRRPAYGLPPEVTLAPGTFVNVRVNQVLSSDHNQQGDAFSATLMQPIVVDGVVVAQRGQTVYGRVAEAQKSHAGGLSRLGLELTGLTLADGTQVPIRTQLVGREGGTTPAGQQAGTIIGTTAVGAAIGAAADWGRGAAIGAVAGAAAGVIGVAVTRNRPTVLYPETALTFRVEAPVAINLARAPQAFRYVDPNEYDRPMEMEPPLQHRAPACGGYGCPPPPYYGPAYYPYPYPYWGGVSVVWGPGYFHGRGYYRRWR